MTSKLMFSKGVTDSKEVLYCIKNFNSTGILFGDGKRNKIKLFEIAGKTINIKSFKEPNLINKIAYKYFRKSKSKRSFEYATILLEKGIGTPQPIAYFENQDFIGLKDSYYVSEHITPDFLFKDLIEKDTSSLDLNQILEQFTQFTFRLHQQGIEFLDHSPGNSLFKKKENGTYEIFLVDLNRMKFHDEMSFELRMKNLSRITPCQEMIRIISLEYAKLYKKDENIVYELLWKYTSTFQKKYYRKKRIKKMIFFWK